MEMRALTASSAIVSARVGEKTGLLMSSEIRTVMIKLPHLKYFRVMRNHSAESEDWTVHWPFSPAEISLSILTALGILQPVTTSKSIPRLFVFFSYHPKWQIVGALFSWSLWDGLIGLLPMLLWGENECRLFVFVWQPNTPILTILTRLFGVSVCSEPLCLLEFVRVCLGCCAPPTTWTELRFSLGISLFCCCDDTSIIAVLAKSPVSKWNANAVASWETSRF